MFQSWEHLTFLHWKYDPATIQALLPEGLTVDNYDGWAWVALTPFVIRNLRLPFMRAVPWISSFPETNVRTYVRDAEGYPGVWFFSLDADRLAAVVGARTGYRLPYQWAQMRVILNGNTVEYHSRRNGLLAHRPAHADIAIAVGSPFAPEELTEFDHFLTARWRLYTTFSGRLGYAQIDHEPWPFCRAEVLRLDSDLVTAAGLPTPEGPPHILYSPRVDVRVAAPLVKIRPQT